MSLLVTVEHATAPLRVKFQGELTHLLTIEDGLGVLAASAAIAEASDQPFAYSAEVAEAGLSEWTRYRPHNLGDSYVRRVPVEVGVMATKGLQIAHGELSRARQALGDRGNSPAREREAELYSLLSHLVPIMKPYFPPSKLGRFS